MSKKLANSSGFTIIELAIVLMVIGIITGAIFKGQDLLEAAKIRSVLNDFNKIKIAVTHYQETFGSLPGDDPMANKRFGSSIASGNGNGFIETQEESLFWQHLYKAGFLNSEKALTSKFGGRYSIIHNPSDKLLGHWIQLGKETSSGANGALLTPKQAQILKAKADGGSTISALEGSIKVMEGAGVSKGQCVQGDQINLTVDAPVCIALTSLE